MKRIKFLSMFVIALSAMLFTSCMDDDDDNNGLSPQEQQTAYNAVKGIHTGNLIYAKWDANKRTSNITDTVQVSWSINSDTTMTLRNIPSSAIASAIADSTIMKAVSEQAPRNIDCYIGFIRLNPVQWLVNPTTVTYNNLEYNGGTHKVSVVFGFNTSWSFGQLTTTATSSKQQMQIVVAGLYVDDKLVNDGISYASAQSNQRVRAFIFSEK